MWQNSAAQGCKVSASFPASRSEQAICLRGKNDVRENTPIRPWTQIQFPIQFLLKDTRRVGFFIARKWFPNLTVQIVCPSLWLSILLFFLDSFQKVQ